MLSTTLSVVPASPVPSCAPDARHERHRRRRSPRRARRGGLPALSPPRPQARPLLDRRRHSRRQGALALRPPGSARQTREVDRREHRGARRSARSRPHRLRRGLAPRGARRGARLPLPAARARRRQPRLLRPHGGGAPPVAALPRHRRHPCRGLSACQGDPPLPIPGAPLPPRALLPRRRRRAPPAGAGRRRDRPRRRRFRRAPDLARSRAPGQAPVPRPRKALGRVHGLAVRFGDPAPPTLPARASRRCSPVTAMPHTVAAAALSAGSLGAFAPPPGVRRLVVGATTTRTAKRAAERLVRRCVASGRRRPCARSRGCRFQRRPDRVRLRRARRPHRAAPPLRGRERAA